MSSRLRAFFLKFGSVASLAAVFAGVWIAVTGTYRPPLWVNVVAAAAVMGVATLLEHAVHARARRSRRTLSRHRKAAAR